MKRVFNKDDGKARRNYRIDSELWPEAKSWDITTVQNNKLYEDEIPGEVNMATQKFIKEGLPQVFEEFYQGINDNLISCGNDEDEVVEFMEEEVAIPLSEILIELACEYGGNLIKKVG